MLFTFPAQRIVLIFAIGFTAAVFASGQNPRIRVAVVSFGSTPTGERAANALRHAVANNPAKDIEVADSDLARSAATGAGYDGSLNLTIEDARNIGAAIGADFYFIGDAQTVRRSPSTGKAYYESFASVFLVSARTGRLILWERPLERRNTGPESEQALLQNLSTVDHGHQFQVSIRRALEDERAERLEAVDSPAPVILTMSGDAVDSTNNLREPRPYRRLKPPYPRTAATSEVEAVVDVLVDVDARGQVGKIQISRWAGYGLDQSVIDTVKQMHFFPAMQNGKPIPMRVLLRYNFRKPPPDNPRQ